MPDPPLTERECFFLRHRAEGKTCEQIATDTGEKPSTVKFHLWKASVKVGKKRGALIAWAKERMMAGML